MSIRKTADILKAISKFDDGKVFLEKMKKISTNSIFEAPSAEDLKKIKSIDLSHIDKFLKKDKDLDSIENCIKKLKSAQKTVADKVAIKNSSSAEYMTLADTATTRLKPVKPPKIKTTRRAERTHFGAIERLQSGKELKIDDVVDLIRTQTASFNEGQILRVLEKYPEADRPLVRKILQKSTQFGNMESLDDISRAIKDIDGVMYTDAHPSLSSSMAYFSKYGNYAGDFSLSEQTGCVIVDDLFLRRLESVPEYLEEIKSKKGLKFLIPEGWTSGMNLFSQTKDLDDMTGWIFEEVKKMKTTHPNMSEDEIISYVLNNPVIQRLKKLGIDTEPTIVRNLAEKTDDSVKAILRQLNCREIKAEDIEKVLTEFDENERKYALEILAHTMQVKTPKTCARQLRRMHHTIMQAHGGSDEGVYYVTTRTRKSYSTVVAQYQYANDLDPRKVIFLEDIERCLPSDARSIVILDDIAGSGDSLQTMYASVAESLYKIKSDISDIIVAPVVTSEEAYQKLHQIQHKGRYITCLPGEFAAGIDVPTAQIMSAENAGIVDNILDGRGYAGGGFSIAFPYMAPDNNSRFFTKLAKLFTLHGRGVKGAEKVDIEAITKEVQLDKFKSTTKPLDWAKIKKELKDLKDLKDAG